MLQDVMTCIREGCTIDAAGFKRERFADRHLKPAEEMIRLFARYPDAIARTEELVARCHFDLGDLQYQYPDEQEEPGLSPQQTLERLTWEGAAKRYRGAVPEQVTAQLRHELRLIEGLSYAPYFLTVNSIVRYARSQKHPLPRPRVRRQLGGVLRARHHQHRPDRHRAPVRTFRFRRTRRTAGYRRRLRA